MCGIVGIINLSTTGFVQQDIAKFNQLLVCDSVRGPDSTGAFSVNKFGNVEFIKEKGNPFDLITTTDYKLFTDNAYSKGRILIGHNRKATIGKVSDETAHPFQEGNIILVHNGTLTNHRQLTNQQVDVDSHAITHAIVEKGYKRALKEIQGAFTLVWYDASDKCLRFVRNDQRPLFMIKSPSNLYLSSEAGLGEWIMSREAFGFTYSTEEVKSNYVYTINVDDPKNISKEKVQFYTPPKVKVINVRVNKKESKSKKEFGGWTGYECHPGDRISIEIENVQEFKKPSSLGYVAVVKAKRALFEDQPPVYINVTQEELDFLNETDDEIYMCEVDRLAHLNNHEGIPFRIYGKNISEYIPVLDGDKNEVFLEEWKSLDNHKCMRCDTETYWKDINNQLFLYEDKSRYTIICPTCMGAPVQ